MTEPEKIEDVLERLRNLGGGTPIDDAWVRTVRMYVAKAESALERERAAVLKVAKEWEKMDFGPSTTDNPRYFLALRLIAELRRIAGGEK